MHDHGAAARSLFPLGLVDVTGPSMVPTLRPRDVVLVRWGAAGRPGDLVVLRHPHDSGQRIVKRAVRRQGDGWWVLGDNPAASEDSRAFGAVPDHLVEGRVVLGVRPLRWRPGHTAARRRAR